MLLLRVSFRVMLIVITFESPCHEQIALFTQFQYMSAMLEDCSHRELGIVIETDVRSGFRTTSSSRDTSGERRRTPRSNCEDRSAGIARYKGQEQGECDMSRIILLRT
jgi:hypothetical protein